MPLGLLPVCRVLRGLDCFLGDSRRYQHKRQLLVVNDGSEGLRIPRAMGRPRGCLM